MLMICNANACVTPECYTIHGQHPPPISGALAGGCGGAEPVPDNYVVMQPGPDNTN
jgi:hypothetical protein